MHLELFSVARDLNVAAMQSETCRDVFLLLVVSFFILGVIL